MIQHLLLITSSLYMLSMEICGIAATCGVSRIVMHVPREQDIGLFFDLTITNRKIRNSEMLNLSVSSAGICTLNATNGDQILAGHIYGGEFGSIEAGDTMTVSLVFPTVSPFNRVGNCPIVVSTVNHRNELNSTKQILYFDTRFETLDPGNHSLRRRKDFTDCRNWDLNYFRNCTPLDCEELYFGKRSFFNRRTNHCEVVPVCLGDGIQYDHYANECVDTTTSITDEEIEQLKSSKFDNNYLEFPNAEEFPFAEEINPVACNFKTNFTLVDFNNCFQRLGYPIAEESIKDSTRSILDLNTLLRSFYYDWFFPSKEEIGENEDKTDANAAQDTVRRNRATASVKIWDSVGHIVMICLLMLLLICAVIIFQILATFSVYIIFSSLVNGGVVLMEFVAPFTVSSTELIGEQNEPCEVMSSASLLSIGR